MGRKVKIGKDRLDKYYHLAKEQGYRARSAFKLIQLAQKYDIFKNCQVLVDLCAAPGGWLQVAKRQMGVSSKIIGVDLVAIKSIPDVVTFKCDITTPQCRKLIMSDLNGAQVDVVLHDGAPNVGSSWDKDSYIQNELVLYSAKLACELLRYNGIFVTKVFRSKDYNSVVWVLSQLFKSVKATKPQSSRNVSAEIFLICTGFKAPEKIDLKFFDPKYVFSNETPTNASIDTLSINNSITNKQTKSNLSELLKGIGKKHRGGYEDGDEYRVMNVHDFFSSNNPALILVKTHKIVFDVNDNNLELIKSILNHVKTTNEIKEYCNDLKVLGKSELMHLLKWRYIVLKDVKSKLNLNSSIDNINEHKNCNDSTSAEDSNNEYVKSDNDEGKDNSDVDEQLESLLDLQRKRNKQLEKKSKALQKKQEWRLSLSKGGFDAAQDEPDLFYYSNKVLQALNSEGRYVDINKYSDDNDYSKLVDLNSSFVLEGNKTLHNYNEYNDDLDEDIDRYTKMDIDIEIHNLLKKSKGNSIDSIQSKKENKETRREKVFADWNKEVNELSDRINRENEEIKSKKVLNDDTDISDDETVELHNQNEENLQNDTDSSRWFSNPVFSDIFNETNTITDFTDNNPTKDDSDSDINEVPDEQVQVLPLNEKKKKKLERKLKNTKNKDGNDTVRNNNSIEFVPKEDVVANMFNPQDEHDVKQVHAIGSLLINKTNRMDLIDGTYNRFSFSDLIDDGSGIGVPKWFAEDEVKHNRPELPVTKELMKQYNDKIREIRNRPIRKESEATARKNRRYEKLMLKVRKQASTISDSNDMTEKSKTKTINDLVKKANKVKSSKRNTMYAVSRRSGTKAPIKKSSQDKNSKIKLVDKRLKKDKRKVAKNIKKSRKKFKR